MNDYIKSGTRQQFWEEYYVRVIMQVQDQAATITCNISCRAFVRTKVLLKPALFGGFKPLTQA